MKGNFIIDDKVMFIPDENKLSPLGARGPEVILNVPVSRFLFLLLKKDGSIALQDEILQEVWEKQGQQVTLNTLYQNVSLLRKALKKAGVINSSVRTHPKVGFSFRGKIQLIEVDSVSSPEMNQPVIPSIGSEVPFVDLAAPKAEKLLQETKPETTTDKPNGYPVGRLKNIIFLALFLVTVVIAAIIITMYRSSNDNFSASHEVVARINQCSLFVDKGNRKSDLTHIIKYLKDKGVTCSQKEFLYLTSNMQQDALLLFTCTTGSEEHLKCVTSIKIPPYLYPD